MFCRYSEWKLKNYGFSLHPTVYYTYGPRGDKKEGRGGYVFYPFLSARTQFTPTKPKMVLRPRKISMTIPIKVLDIVIETKTAVQHLGLWSDNKPNFFKTVSE